jgi:hypothetical protein
LVKTRLGAYEPLRDRCSFTGSWQAFPDDKRGFVHFIWAKNEQKPRRMQQYLRYLHAAAGAEQSPA